MARCVLFVDGTLRRVCRPKEYQESIYSGHKKHHGLKYQGAIGAWQPATVQCLCIP